MRPAVSMGKRCKKCTPESLAPETQGNAVFPQPCLQGQQPNPSLEREEPPLTGVCGLRARMERVTGQWARTLRRRISRVGPDRRGPAGRRGCPGGEVSGARHPDACRGGAVVLSPGERACLTGAAGGRALREAAARAARGCELGGRPAARPGRSQTQDGARLEHGPRVRGEASPLRTASGWQRPRHSLVPAPGPPVGRRGRRRAHLGAPGVVTSAHYEISGHFFPGTSLEVVPYRHPR